MEHWSKRLSRALDAKGMTPAELVRLTGLGKGLVYQYVRGEVDQPRPPVLARISSVLGVTVGWLMYGDTNHGPIGNNSLAVRKLPIIPLHSLKGMTRRGQLADFASGEFLPVPSDVGPRAAGIRIEDESGHPIFRVGDIAIVDPDQPPIPGRYVLAIVDGTPVVRRFRPTSAAPDAAIELVPEHPDYPTVTLANNGHIVGRVTKRISDV